MSKRKLTIVLYAAFGIFAALFLLHGVRIQKEWLDDASLAISIALIGVAIFDRYLWKLPILRGWLVSLPDISGTWKGIIHSNWKDPKTGKAVAPIEAYFAINQSASSFHFKQMTEDSDSELIGVEIVPSEDKSCLVAGVYVNEPRIAKRKSSPIHYGGIILRIGQPAGAMRGTYWTDRATAGEIRLEKRIRKTHTSFESAQRAFKMISV